MGTERSQSDGLAGSPKSTSIDPPMSIEPVPSDAEPMPSLGSSATEPERFPLPHAARTNPAATRSTINLAFNVPYLPSLSSANQ